MQLLQWKIIALAHACLPENAYVMLW